MSDRDDDELAYDLSAWEAPPPPAGIADGVIGRMRADSAIPAVPAEPVANPRRQLVIGGIAAACLVASVGTYALIRSANEAAPRSGAVIADRARTLSLDGASADLDPGARVEWRRDGDTLVVHQAAGAAAWRVEGDRQLRIDAGAMVASVEATGASLRVEVNMNATDARMIGASALTAAAVSLVTVTVYNGHVKAGASGQPMVIVPAGTTQTFPPPTPVVVDHAPVVAGTPPTLDSEQAKHELEKREAEIAELRAKIEEQDREIDHHRQVTDKLPELTVAESGGMLGRAAISKTVLSAKSKLQGCVKHAPAGGMVKIKATVAPTGKVSRSEVMETYDADVGKCVVKIITALTFPKSDEGVTFSYPFIMQPSQQTAAAADEPEAPASCDPDVPKEKGMQQVNAGQHAAALAYFEAALRCKADTHSYELAFMESCASGNAAKAKLYYKKLEPRKQARLSMICIRQKPPVAYE